MNFFSTRNTHESVGFQHALFRGLAPDGGLYHPDSEPDLGELIRSYDSSMPFSVIASSLTAALFPNEFSPRASEELAEAAFPFGPQLRELDERNVLLELFHGPSCAFKDFGASFLAAAMEHFLTARTERAVILTATSGDTGSAVAQAFHERDKIDVVILYPSNRVSPLQEKQLTTLGGNVTALEVLGSFDDCQRMVKEAFVDPSLNTVINLTSANSINVGRLIPQAFYYVWTYAQLKARCSEGPVFCVPSGNFGNLTAGVLAWRWGMPAKGFIAASNENDVVPEFLATGEYSPRASVQTLANAMDVGAPSNFERLRRIFDDENLDITRTIRGYRATDDDITETMRDCRERYGEILCPHTAAGMFAAQLDAPFSGGQKVVTLGTAHPAKFLEVCEMALGERPHIPKRLAQLLHREKRANKIEPNATSLRNFLLDAFGA